MNRREVKRAPVLRFKGFTNDWEQHKLGDETNRIKSYSISHGFEVAEDTGTKYIHYGDIHTSKVKNINNIDVLPNIKDNNYKPLKYGDVIVADASEDYKGIADACIVNTISDSYKIVAGLHTIAFRPKSKLCSKFLYFYLSTDIFKHFGYKTGTGLKVFGISYKELAKFKLKEPSVTEQKKIVKLLFLIEKAINLQQRKLELLKASKKAVLQNIFTDTKRVPTIRFNTFSENWNQKRLKPFLIKYNKKTTVNNQYPVLTSSRQGLFFQKDYYDGNQIASKNNIGYNIVPRNYFTYRHMSDDLIFHFNINTICDYGIVSTLYPVFTTTSEIDSQWLLYYLNHSVDIKKYALLQKQGGSRTYMYFSKLESLKAHIPALAEQKKISSLIFKIDEQIYFQQKKLKYLQKSKRFLLQNMFI